MTDQTVIRHDIGQHGELELRTVSGSIRLAGDDGNDVVVTVRGDSNALRDLAVERAAGRLLVQPQRVDAGWFKRTNVSFEFDVVVPRGARVDIKAVSADVIASGLAGEQAYKTVSGDVHLSGGGGRIAVQSVSGDLHVNGARQLELSATTTSGDVHVDAQLVEHLRAKTVSGDVRLAGRLADGPRHTVETVSGDLILNSVGGVTVERSRALDIGRSGRQPVVIGDGSAQLTFRSMSGEERVTGPTGFADARPPKPAAAPKPPAPPRPVDPWPISNPDEPTVASMAAYPWEPPPPPAEPSAPPVTRLDILRALERGDIDIEEAARRLEEVGVDA
jgi:putative adhesin